MNEHDEPRSALSIPGIERQLVGGLCLLGDSFHGISAVVEAGDFEDRASRATFEAVAALGYFQKPEPVDVPSLASWLTAHRPIMPPHEWNVWLAESMAMVASPAHVPHNARSVARAALGRRLLGELGQLRAKIDAHSPIDHEGQEQMIDSAFERIGELVEAARNESLLVSLADVVAQEAALLTADEPTATAGRFRYGLADIDQVTRGLHAGEVVVIGAATSQGKSTLALQVALNTAEQGARTLVYSLEMAPDEVARRTLANVSGLDLFGMRRALNIGERDGLQAATSRASGWPLKISGAHRADIQAICSEARAFKREGGLDVLVIDYLQLVEGPQSTRENRAFEVGAVSRQLKQLAQELECAIIAPSQLNDGAEQGEPKLCHLRESRAIGHNANVVLLLWTDEDSPGVMHCKVAKNRHGECKRLKLQWHRPTYRVRDLSTWRTEAIYDGDDSGAWNR